MIIENRTSGWPLLAAAFCAGLAPAQTGEAVITTRVALEKWVETRDILSKETRDWAQAKESLTARMDVVKREIVALQKRTAEAEASIAEADQKRRDLQAESERLKAATAGTAQLIDGIEQRVLQLLPRLPDPLRDRIKPISQQITGKGDDSKLTVRYANVIGVLNEVQKWNREITVTSEVRAMPDGSSVEVTVLYVGLGQAWYVGGNGRVAGVGIATAAAWIWRPQNELAAAIGKAVAVFRNEQPAAFVQLPVQVQ